MQLDPRFRRCFDSSDLVQETLRKAQEHLGQCRAETEAQLIGWLHRILTNTAYDWLDKYQNEAKMQSLQAVRSASSVRLPSVVVDTPSPSQKAETAEQLLRLADALDQLPQDKRDVIIHHHMLGTPVAQIAAEMGRTEKAVAGLLYWGKRKLRELLNHS
jgi:RNA polymerase sigma factor (sigma-70 family)